MHTSAAKFAFCALYALRHRWATLDRLAAQGKVRIIAFSNGNVLTGEWVRRDADHVAGGPLPLRWSSVLCRSSVGRRLRLMVVVRAVVVIGP